MEFCKAFNSQTQQENGRITPVDMQLVYEDLSFDFYNVDASRPRSKSRRCCASRKGSAEPNREKVGRLTRDQVRQIAEIKMPDLNARDVEGGDEGRRRHGALDGSGDRPGEPSWQEVPGGPVRGFDREELYSPTPGGSGLLKGFWTALPSTRPSRRTSTSG